MTGGEAHGAVEKSVVKKLGDLEWVLGRHCYSQIRIAGMGKKYAERISLGPRN